MLCAHGFSTYTCLPASQAKIALQPVLNEFAQIAAMLAPYEQIKSDLIAARACYRDLTNAFVAQLKCICDVMREDEKRTLVLELFAEDVHVALDAAVSEKRRELEGFVEGIWDKYHIALIDLRKDREAVGAALQKQLKVLGYS